jgi:hypothetical protein
MSWDPDIDDPTTRRHPYTEGGDDGMSTESRPGMPDLLAPIDPDAPVSGHVPPQEGKPIAQAPEHDWSAAQAGLYPLLRPVGTLGTHLDSIERATLAQHADQKHTTPLIDDGPQGTVVVYAIASSGFDVIANGDHVLAWGVPPAAVREAAYRNLSAWSAENGWVDETDGDRRLVSSATGSWDASRILLPEVRAHLSSTLGGTRGRVLVGLPDRDLLAAAFVPEGDAEFERQFCEFVTDQAEAADEPIDGRVFELRDGQLVAVGS